MVCENMGKASKWIRNFLLGKRDKDDRKRVRSYPEEALGSPKADLSVTKEKRRWSFRKPGTTCREKITHRNRSFDSISTSQLVKQVLEEHEIEQIRIKAVFVKTCNQVSGRALVATATKDAAAIKIQSAFRSSLARKALRALRALVRLQALVRGHLVRKQTTAVLRSMHALMSIQVRARYKRVQMVEAAGSAENYTARTYHEESDPRKLPSKIRINLDKLNGHETRRLQCKSGPLEVPRAERILEQGLISRCHSSRLSTCTEEDQHDGESWSPSSIWAEIISSQKKAEHIFNMLEYSKTKPTKLPPSVVPQALDINPSYMSNTKSSKAKARSQSEPKQRPKRNSN